MSLCPVILAGGGGTRLWPLSREYYPKQFLRLFGRYSMLQETVLRLDGIEAGLDLLDPLFVCNEVHRFLLAEQIHQINRRYQSILLEPQGRNTAPALTVAAIALLKTNPDTVMIMMPADHHITNQQEFQNVIKAGYKLAQQGVLITCGIVPEHAETGYGYIRTGQKLQNDLSADIYALDSFTEKPDVETAQSYIGGGKHLWNSGIFMMQASVWCEAIKHFQPDIFQSCQDAFTKGSTDNHFYRLDKESFIKCRSDSIDYAVMEKLTTDKTFKSAVIALDAGWSDVGAWSALWKIRQQDNNNNVTDGDVILNGTRNSLVRSENRLVVAVGCENMVIVETADAVVVANKDKAQEMKHIVDTLKTDERAERLTHRKVYRPWGSYETLDSGDRFQVKRIEVKPGKKLSLQLHHKRAEHWVVVNGTARVTRGEETFDLSENESTFIPLGTKHRLENATDRPLEIIEVQSGMYLGEDDIVRFEDDFGRK
jgi:mannose-1-phosphate guanylyltransferase / mannose-6-phosphate isomerase